MRKVRKRSGLWKYLIDTGVLENGSDEDILRAKKEYRKTYHKTYKRSRRKEKREYCVACTKSEEEILKKAAKEHGLSVPRFIKKSSLTYLKQGFLIPHPETLYRVEQLLLAYKNAIWQMSQKDKTGWFKAENDYQNLENIILRVQHGITSTFKNPPSLDQVIWQTLISNPVYRTSLLEIIAKYDSQKSIT